MSQLTPRAAQILAALVADYIDTGEPVGSARLTKLCGLNVSPATVRNTLAELEELGYLQQPHTSAGRIPTDRGYRFYVDQLLAAPRSVRSGAAVEAQLRRDAGNPALAEDVLLAVSQVLSRASRLVAFALPMTSDGILKEIETKVLVIVVSDGGQVSRKAIEVGEEVDAYELRRAANYLNTEFAGMSIEHIRLAVLERLRHERTLADALGARALKLAQTSLEELPKRSQLFVDGASSLLGEAGDDHGISLTMLSALLRMVEEKERLVHLLTEYIDGPGMTIVIGQEHRTPDLRAFSIIASTYADGSRIGTVGVIGPMRMHYSRTIAVVDGVAQAVSRVLRDSM
jgi:heat-inducible transcriptional repressor